MKFRIIRLMTQYAIEEKVFWWWEKLTYDKYSTPCTEGMEKDIIKLDTKEEAQIFLAYNFKWANYEIIK